MSETIKLFGKMIQLSSNTDEDTVIASRTETSAALSAAIVDIHCDSSSSDQNFLCSKQGQNRGNEDTSTDAAMETKQEGEQSSTSVLEESKTPTSPSINSENPETKIKDKVSSSQDLAKKDKEQDSDEASSNSESPDQNPLKKPDKILPCARCNSMDTKFCYYNNYNVNQPRHFCKNCQRYWTAGGSMRNVPVGAGRRKSKNSTASQHRHLIIPGASDGLIHHLMRPDGTVLAFGLDSPLSDQSKSSMLRLGEGPQNVFTNGCFRSENGKKCSITMSNSNSISIEKGEKCNGGKESSEVVPSFPFSWNPMPWQSGYPVSFYSTSTPQWGEALAGPCNLNWFPTPSMNSDQSSTNSSPISSILGKHSREGTKFMPCNTNNKESPKEKELEDSRVGIPKTMRVDDPFEAAKSSIWTSIGIKNSHVGSSNGRLAFFGGLQQVKGVNYVRRNINQNVEASSMVLQANPAAFSRSLAFHEIAQ